MIVSVKNAVRYYGDVRGVDGLNLSVEPGQIVGLLGPNGAGKTTAIHLMMGLLRVDRGSVRVFGDAPDATTVRRRVGIMLQQSGVPDTLTPSELIANFRTYYPHPRSVEEVHALSGVGGFAHRRVARLSGGQRQRLLFALALVGNPDLLFLDEPTVGLDVAIRQEFWDVIRAQADNGTAVILTTHYLEEVDILADAVVVLNEGHEVFSGSPEALKRQVPTRRVRCRTVTQADQMRDWPEVVTLSTEDGVVDLVVTQAESVVRRLLEIDPQLSGLEVRGAHLEEAFVAMTQRREAA